MKFLYIGIVVTIFLVVYTDALWNGGRRRRRRRRSPPPPPPPCKVSPWSSWSECNHECGNAGLQTRNKYDCCRGTCRETMKETRLCNRHACRNGGKPLNGRCSCRGGYTGTCCETDICRKIPCQHRCVNFGHSYRCLCDPCYTKVGTKCELRQCIIGSKCYGYNEVNPVNNCQYCKKGHETQWTEKSINSPCNDGNPCTRNDRCVHGVCKGSPFSCKSCQRCDGSGCKRIWGYSLLGRKCLW